MGCSNPHPHGQAWSLSVVPTMTDTEFANFAPYSLSDPAPSAAPRGPKNRPCLLCEYAHFEIGVPHDTGRVVFKNEHWVALVPWWAIWPFEILCTCGLHCHSRSIQLINFNSAAIQTSRTVHLTPDRE